MKQNVNIPAYVMQVLATLQEGGFEAYLVGGCVRDVLMNKEPNDWDITTNAHPKQVQKLFPDSVYENDFGTVGVKVREAEDIVHVVEVTTFRKEVGYSDKRHPDEVVFAETVEEDLARRDFTMNAIAMVLTRKHETRNTEHEVEQSKKLITHHSSLITGIIDPFGGQEDIKKKLIRAVGDASERFGEDALRMMRAVRFYAQLSFEIEKETKQAIVEHASLLPHVAYERIRDEFFKMIMGDDAARAMQLLYETRLLEQFASELVEAVGVEQNLHHIYTVWEHSVRALEYAVKQNYSLEVRLAALLHDIGKPRTKDGEGKYATFYNHEMVSARMARALLSRLHAPKKILDDVVHLVRQHQFNYNVGEVSEAGVRRLLKRVGPEYMDDLLKVREADRIGSGVPKAVPYKLRHLQFMIEKVQQDPISPKMLALKGDEVMEIAGIAPSPKVGMIINALMEEVLDDPSNNTKEYLQERVKTLAQLSEDELAAKAVEGKEKQEALQEQEEKKIKRQFWVK
jgi:poly(A) polymerase/tRNA nucleotidyltransferase (CCA-adding enzyme)